MLTASELQEIEQAYRRHWGRHRWLRPLGAPRVLRQWVRWQWPPIPDHPTWGWRAQVMARWQMGLRITRPWLLWAELWQVAEGRRPYSARLEALERGWRGELARRRDRHQRPFRVVLEGGAPRVVRQGGAPR